MREWLELCLTYDSVHYFRGGGGSSSSSSSSSSSNCKGFCRALRWLIRVYNGHLTARRLTAAALWCVIL